MDFQDITPDPSDRPILVADVLADEKVADYFYKQRDKNRARFQAFRSGKADWFGFRGGPIEPKEGNPKPRFFPKIKTLDPNKWYNYPGIKEKTGQWQRFSRDAKRTWDPEILAYVRKVAKALYPYGIQFKKILGAGGFGWAALFEMRDKDGNSQQFVFKYGIKRDRRSIREAEREKRILWRHAGALHIIQPVVIPQEIRNSIPVPAIEAGPSTAAAGPPQGTPAGTDVLLFFDDLNQIPNSMIVEYCSRGTLDNWLFQLGHRVWVHKEKTARLPERVAREMLACLLRGVIAMEFPPLTADEIRAGEWARHPAVSESVPQPVYETWPLIHFDLDPQNVLIGDFKQPYRMAPGAPLDPHEAVPVLKINDFGLARFFSPADFLDLKRMWNTRKCGKPDYLTPEQFSIEWDWAKFLPDDPNLYKTAGKYSWKTNLWCVGGMMQACMSLYRPDPRRWPTMENIIIDPDPTARNPQKKRMATYGGHLINLENFSELKMYSVELRHFVAQCLAEAPENRPSLERVQDVLNSIGNYPWDLARGDQDDISTREWVTRSMGTPSNPPNWTPQQLQDWFDEKVNMPGGA